MEDLGTGQKKSIIANAHLERAVGVLHEHGWLWADQASKLLEEAKGNLATLESLPAFAEQFAETCRVLGTVLVHKNATHGNAELARCVKLSCDLCALFDVTDLFRLIHDTLLVCHFTMCTGRSMFVSFTIYHEDPLFYNVFQLLCRTGKNWSWPRKSLKWRYLTVHGTAMPRTAVTAQPIATLILQIWPST